MSYSSFTVRACHLLIRSSVLVAVLLVGIAPLARAQDPQQQQPPPTPPPVPAQQPPPTPAPTTSTPAPAKPADSGDRGEPRERSGRQEPDLRLVAELHERRGHDRGQADHERSVVQDGSARFVRSDGVSVVRIHCGVAQLQNEPASWGGGWSGYAKRYGAAFTDNTVCSLVTTGLLPSILKQDPRYYQGHATGFFNRLAYAASRSVVTKSRSGQPQFNLSEIGGTLIVANVGNLYYPVDERNVPDTLQRWGMQTMWDTVANELKEFWPDIRKVMHGR
jgi:hypothetical protein